MLHADLFLCFFASSIGVIVNYRSHYSVIIKDKENYLEHLILAAPVASPGQQVPPQALAAHTAWVKGQKEVAILMLFTMDLEIQRNLAHLGAYDMLQELKTMKGSEKLKNKSHKAAKGGHGKGKGKMGYASNNASFSPKPKTPPQPPKKDNPAKDAICHQCVEVGHWRRNCPVYLTELMKKKKLSQGASISGIFTIELYSFPIKSWIYDTGCGTHICITTQGLQGSKKLKQGALSLYVGDGHHAAVKAIGTYHLELPISKNNLVYFMAVPWDGIFEIDMSCSNTNDSSIRYGYVYLLKPKHEVFETFKVFQKEVENQLRKTIKSLRSDYGGEYMSQEFLYHLKEHEIIAHRTPPYTSQNNRVSERRNRTLLDMVRSMMSQTTLPKSFWDYALETAVRILNMVRSKKRDTLTKPDKPDLRSFKWILVGYPKETMGYSFYSPSENKVFVAQNAKFFESKLLDLKASGSVKDLELIQEEDTNPSVDTSLNHEEDDQEINEPQSDINPIRKSSRTRRTPDRMCLYIDAKEHELGDLGEPANYKAALLDSESKKWLDAMNVEIQSMKDNDVRVLVELPPNA
nr:hypothetical protein [Tanacetum cinerariifolium]